MYRGRVVFAFLLSIAALRVVGQEPSHFVPQPNMIVVEGCVKKSGGYRFRAGGMTVLNALAEAWGLTQNFSHFAVIYRVDDNGVRRDMPIAT